MLQGTSQLRGHCGPHWQAEGKSNKDIAAENFVELSTVKTHINNIYAKLGVNSRREAIKVYTSRKE